MSRYKLEEVNQLAGFALNAPQKGEKVKVQTLGIFTSDEDIFHRSAVDLMNGFLGRGEVEENSRQVNSFLLLIHEDQSADLFINEGIELKLGVLNKSREIREGDVVRKSDIADIRSVEIENVDISENDRIVLCTRIGWKFGCFFDLRLESENRLDELSYYLSQLLRGLVFQEIFQTLEDDDLYQKMKQDGWFPFLELLGDDFDDLRWLYKTDNYCENRLSEKFGEERIGKIKHRWWSKEIFENKKPILQKGLNDFLEDTQQGDISCFKILVSEIDGVIREIYYQETGKGKAITSDLKDFVKEKGRKRGGGDSSLLLPSDFFDYLDDKFYDQFDLAKGGPDVARPSSTHGVVDPEKYTHDKALQAILTLDQLYFYF